jgi:hypothetical protein
MNKKRKQVKKIILIPKPKPTIPASLQIIHQQAGFFSCCSVRLHEIIEYFNQYKRLPKIVDSSEEFLWYKPPDNNGDITFDYFEHYNNVSLNKTYNHTINYDESYQYSNYQNLQYHSIIPFVKKYFSPSHQIKNLITNLEKKYFLKDYANICVLFYRGNDKITETNLSSYKDFIERARILQQENPDINFLIQSDETEFIEFFTHEFPSNSFYFKDEIRYIQKQSSTTVDKVFSREQNNLFSKYYLAITIIMSKCKYIICNSGNCSIWIMLYRENANGVQQFLNEDWIHY